MFKRRDSALGRRVLVNLLSGNAIDGVCTYESREHMLLRGAVVHTVGSDATPPADGEVRIDKANVDFTQLF